MFIIGELINGMYKKIGKAIADEKRITDDIEAKLRQALETFKNTWQA